MRQRNIIFSVVGIVLFLVFVGCSEEGNQSDAENEFGTIRVSVDTSALNSSHIASLTLRVYSSPTAYVEVDPTTDPQEEFPITIDTTLSGEVYSGTAANIRVGANRYFVAEAFDSDGVKIFAGSETMTIVPGDNGTLSIVMHEVIPHDTVERTAPLINSLLVSDDNGLVTPGTNVSFTVNITYPDPSVGLTIYWQMAGPTGNWVNLPSPNNQIIDGDSVSETFVWTAASAGSYSMSIGVVDVFGLHALAVFSNIITVYNVGEVDVNVSVNQAPVMFTLIPSDSYLQAGDSTTLKLTLSDPGDTLTYGWYSVDCLGSYVNATVADSAVFNLSSEYTNTTPEPCTLGVTATDSAGNQSSIETTLYVGPLLTASY